MPDAERDFVRWLAARCRKPVNAVSLGIGDDMAILHPPGDSMLITCDMLLDGIHFDTRRHSLAEIGYKAAACSLSDCAAMAVRPLGGVLSIALPGSFSVEHAKELAGAVAEALEGFGAALLGGDTTSWPNALAIDVAVLATPYPNVGPVRRDGARPGDDIFVTGSLGGSLLGRHFLFTPRIHEARAIAEALGSRLHAMLDISDGLGLDLDRIAEASGVGATLDESAVLEVADEAAHRAAAGDGRSVLDHVLGDGEDFELLLCAADVEEATASGLGLRRVGSVTQESQLRLRDATGKTRLLQPVGYQHLQ